MQKYKERGYKTLFDDENRYEKLSKKGNPLEKLSKVVDFEMFRSDLEETVLNNDKKSKVGAKPYDVVMMFKIMVIQRYYNLSDDQTEYQIEDRVSFRRFLGLSSGDKVPDAKTIWLFREKLVKSKASEMLFQKFVDFLNDQQLIFNEGRMVDASFVLAPRQHNTPEENKQIKQGDGNELWKDQPHKKSQKDIDARWTQKGGVNYYGYKNHIKGDTKSKLIISQETTTASSHDSQSLDNLFTEKDKGQNLYADSAYVGQGEILKKYDVKDRICEKSYRGHPLTEKQKENNKIKSHTRCLVEHIFGFMECVMNKLFVRTIGIARAKSVIGMNNLIYNMFRYEQIVRLKLFQS